MFTYVKFTANLWIANLVNEIHQWFSLCKVAFYNYSEKSNSHQKTHLQKQTEHHPEKKKTVWNSSFWEMKKINRKMNANHMFKRWIFQLWHGFSTSIPPKKNARWSPHLHPLRNGLRHQGTRKAQGLRNPGEDKFQPGSKKGVHTYYVHIYIGIYIYRYSSYVCIYKCICIICIWIHTSIQSETQENTSF